MKMMQDELEILVNSRGDRMEHAYQCRRDARLGKEFWHQAKDRGIIVIETDNHAAPHVDAVLLNAMHAFKERASLGAHILIFLGLPKLVFVWRLDADEDVLKICETHQVHQFIILSEIERGLGEES